MGEIEKPKPWAKAFIENLKKFGIVSVACRATDVARSTVYAERDKNEDFRALWADAQAEAYETLESLLWRRATVGDVYEKRTETWTNADGEPVKRITETHRISDTALIFALKAVLPHKYRENVRVEQTGPGGTPIQVEVGPMPRTRERVEKLLELARESEEQAQIEPASSNGSDSS